MSTIGSYDGKTLLPDLLRRVEAGERITITRHGHPIARLVFVADEEAVAPREAVDALLEFRKGRTLGKGLSVRD